MTEQSTPIESRSRDHVMAEIVHNLTLAMQVAWIEWQHGGGADQAMQWIENTLWGPGLIPDEDESHGKEAQAYFDAHTVPDGRLEKLMTENPDDAAIDRFAIELKKKLAKAREKCRGGWQICHPTDLSRMLREHVDKGDPRDVANFCAFLWALGHPISPAALCFELTLVPPDGAAAPAPCAPPAALTDAQIAAQDARYAIDGAITYGRTGTNKPPVGHWLTEYWHIGRQLAKLGETSAWDNQTPLAAQPVAYDASKHSAECIADDCAGCIAAEPAEPFQTRVQPWMLACFGAEIAADRQERNHRFLEEALELVQACGATASEAHQLVDYVYGRPVGEKQQEVGGVMVTLAALCLAQGLDMHAAGETELARIWTKVEQIRAKQAAKPKHSPLPEHVPIEPAHPDRQGVALSDEEAFEAWIEAIPVSMWSAWGRREAAHAAWIFVSSRASSSRANLLDFEEYQLQMAAISTAAIGYWKEGDSIHPDYDTLALRDVAKLYAKYAALYRASSSRAEVPAGYRLQPISEFDALQTVLDAASSRAEVERVTDAMVRSALGEAWNDFVSDTGCYPSCFEVQRGKRIEADFERAESAFIDYIAGSINAALAAAEAPNEDKGE